MRENEQHEKSVSTALDEMAHVAGEATQGPWRRCTANEGNCPCRTIWSKPLDDSPFCLAPSGPGETVQTQDWKFVATFDPPTVLTLIAIARAAQAVRAAWRDIPRNDSLQGMQDNLARALDELVTLSHEHPPADGTIAALAATIVAAGGALPYPGTVAEAAATPTDTVPNPQPQDRDLILGILQDLDRRVLQALADNYPQGRKMEAEQSAALRRLLERAEVFNPQPDDRDLILEVIHDLDRRVLQARADDDPQGCELEAEQSAALRRLLERADDYLGWQARDAQVGRPA